MPSKLYSTPVCVVIEILPDGIAHVGCTTLEVVGTTGGVGIALIVIAAEDGVTQVLSAVFITYKV